MSSRDAIMLAIHASLAAMVAGVGLRSTFRDVGALLRHPALLVRSFIAMSVLMPLLALALAASFALTPAVSLALIALTLAPVPPLLPGKAARAGGEASYAVALFATASALAIVVVPVSLRLIDALVDADRRMPPLAVATLVGSRLLLPLLVGLGVRAIAPRAAERLVKPVTIVSTVALVAAVIPLLVTAWPAMYRLVGNGTLAAIVGLTVAGLGIGHVLGGPRPPDRTVLALCTATRHPAVAVAILAANFPGDRSAIAAVLLATVVGAIAAAPYMVWRTRTRHRTDVRDQRAAATALPLAFSSPQPSPNRTVEELSCARHNPDT